MPFIGKIFSPLQNCETAALLLCQTLRLSITRTSLVDAIKTHPDYPSMLSISDVMKKFNVDNISLKITETNRLIDLNLPCIVQVKHKQTNYPLFAIVLRLNDNTITWVNPISRKQEEISHDYFQTIFTGFVQCYEVGVDSGEADFAENRRREKKKNFINAILVLIIPALTLILSTVAICTNGYNAIAPSIYTLLILIGVITSTLLLLYEIDQYNPTLQQICGGGGKTNCAAILHSNSSKIFGIHWSVIGFSYFMGVLAVLLAGGLFNTVLLSTAAWLNILALPYIFYSIYYQGKIVKQWCPMCLTIQVLFILLFATSLSGRSLSISSISMLSILPFVISIGVVFLAVSLLLPSLEKNKIAKHYFHSLQRLKHNPQIFEVLLAKQKMITESTEGLGITLGNPNGKIHLIKVCNPYCGPCAKAHPIIDELLENNPEIKMQIIFIVTEADDDYRNKPVRILSTINQKESEVEMKNALEYWYLSDEKDYEQFHRQYPYEQEVLNAQSIKIKAMREWCEKMGIAYTPTFFINGHQLPELYSLADLRYFLSV